MTALDLDLRLPATPTPAAQPPEARGISRDGVRMLVIDRRNGTFADARFRDLSNYLAERIGQPIRYGYTEGQIDLGAYQTFFAREPGSVEMPSAARPFTRQVARELFRKGIRIMPLVLHCGLSSHEVENGLEHHPVLPEWYNVPESTATAVNRHLAEGRRVIAVGTTVVRALESAARPDGTVSPGAGWTTLLVTPDRPPRVASGLVTGLHESQTSHLALLYAFLPAALLGAAYHHALAAGYLWHEFGDSCLIL